jgi:hypothetical protein
MGYDGLMRNLYILFVVASGATALVGCGRPYHMEVQAVPSPFTRPGCRAIVEPVHSEGLMVGAMPEAAYLAEKKAESGESYLIDKTESDQLFHQAIMDNFGTLVAPGGPPDNTFVIRPRWTHWEPGFVGFVSRPARADFLVEVVAPTGQVLDRFDFETVVGSSLYNPSSGGRMRSALKRAGNVVSAYIGDNWLCAAH